MSILLDMIPIIVTLLEKDDLRVANVEGMKKKFPNLRVMPALDGVTQWDEVVRFIEDWEIPLRYDNRKAGDQLNKKGKVARWATLIKAMKYVYDHKLGNTVILEDDVTLPEGFDFGEDKWEDGHIAKLAMWGEGYGVNHTGAEHYLRMVCEAEQISLHSDEFIARKCKKAGPGWIINSKLGGHLVVATNKGHLINSPTYDYEFPIESYSRTQPLINKML